MRKNSHDCDKLNAVYILAVTNVAVYGFVRARGQERERKIQMLNLELTEVKDTLQVSLLQNRTGCKLTAQQSRTGQQQPYHETMMYMEQAHENRTGNIC